MLGLSENGYSENRTLLFFPEYLMALYLGWPSAIYIVGDIPSISLASGNFRVMFGDWECKTLGLKDVAIPKGFP